MIAASPKPPRAAAVAKPERNECAPESPASPAPATRDLTISPIAHGDRLAPIVPWRSMLRKTLPSVSSAAVSQSCTARTAHCVGSAANAVVTSSPSPSSRFERRIVTTAPSRSNTKSQISSAASSLRRSAAAQTTRMSARSRRSRRSSEILLDGIFAGRARRDERAA